MADLNTTAAILEPYFSTVDQVFGTISLFVGGIFGVFLITLIVKLVFLRKIFSMQKEVDGRLERMESKIDKLIKKKR